MHMKKLKMKWTLCYTIVLFTLVNKFAFFLKKNRRRSFEKTIGYSTLFVSSNKGIDISIVLRLYPNNSTPSVPI